MTLSPSLAVSNPGLLATVTASKKSQTEKWAQQKYFPRENVWRFLCLPATGVRASYNQLWHVLPLSILSLGCHRAKFGVTDRAFFRYWVSAILCNLSFTRPKHYETYGICSNSECPWVYFHPNKNKERKNICVSAVKAEHMLLSGWFLSKQMRERNRHNSSVDWLIFLSLNRPHYSPPSQIKGKKMVCKQAQQISAKNESYLSEGWFVLP